MARKLPRTPDARHRAPVDASPAINELHRMLARDFRGAPADGWAPELGRVERTAAGSFSILFDADRLDGAIAVAVGVLREQPDRAEDLVRALAARLEVARQALEIERRWRVQRAAAGARGRTGTMHPRHDEIVRLIRSRWLSDHGIAKLLGVDRAAVRRVREGLGLTPRQVRARRDDL